jgi:hypothetical protein
MKGLIMARNVKMVGWSVGLILTAAAGQAIAQPAPTLNREGVVREWEGARVVSQSKMELTAFPADAWGLLSEWAGGKALAPADSAGSPVLIAMWSDWHRPSARAAALGKRLAEQYAKDGLIVVLVHNSEGWKDAAKPAADAPAKLLVALDAKNEFRAKLGSDADPDFYVIDRAGQLRFADIATESVEKAVEVVVKESRDKAGSINERLAEADKKRREEEARTAAIRAKVDLTDIPDVPFTAPSETDYLLAGWPPARRDESGQSQGPMRFEAISEDTPMLPRKPKTRGRAIIAYFWNPDFPESYRTMDRMDLLQTQNRRDLVVVGVLSPLSQTGMQDPSATSPEAFEARLKGFLRNRTPQHFYTVDPTGQMLQGVNQNSQQEAMPFAVVVSTDGVVRYAGSAGRDGFKIAVDRVLAVDPAIKNRRAAEDAYLKSKGQ